MNLGDTFLMSVPPSYDRPHFWIVISDPQQNGGAFLVVNATTDEFRAGRECVLLPTDHGWIKEDSFVSFGDALEITSDKARGVAALIGTKIHPQEPMSEAALSRIIEAAKKSKALPGGLKEYFA